MLNNIEKYSLYRQLNSSQFIFQTSTSAQDPNYNTLGDSIFDTRSFWREKLAEADDRSWKEAGSRHKVEEKW